MVAVLEDITVYPFTLSSAEIDSTDSVTMGGTAVEIEYALTFIISLVGSMAAGRWRIASAPNYCCDEPGALAKI
jgi:hypothetical protein